ncbi:MAG: sulfite exporter TauE/SafE family protein [Bacilli bacterium]
MKRLLIILIVGFFAQLVDGALGMSYGLTSTTLLLTIGLAPAIASATVHFSEMFTTSASALMHLRFGNVDRKTLWSVVPTGVVGAFLGAFTISFVPVQYMKPAIALFLFSLGLLLLWRLAGGRQTSKPVPMNTGKLRTLGFFGGFFDTSGGGGWGPICTPILLQNGALETRKVVGTVDTAEFFVSLSASVAFILALGTANIPWDYVLLFIIGGVCAAPLAAWLVRIVPEKPLTLIISLVILTTNAQSLVTLLPVSNLPSYTAFVVVGTVALLILIIRFVTKRIILFRT